MILCIDHADAVENSDCIAESLFNETMVKRKTAAFILHNSSIKVSNASYFRKL